MTQATSNTLSHLTDEERRLLELAEKATERPWSVRNNHGAIDITAKARRICKMIYHEGSEDCEVDTNAAYIAAACNNTPALLTTIGQLRGELEGVKLERDRLLPLIRAHVHLCWRTP